jgi:hypothetical protein
MYELHLHHSSHFVMLLIYRELFQSLITLPEKLINDIYWQRHKKLGLLLFVHKSTVTHLMKCDKMSRQQQSVKEIAAQTNEMGLQDWTRSTPITIDCKLLLNVYKCIFFNRLWCTGWETWSGSQCISELVLIFYVFFFIKSVSTHSVRIMKTDAMVFCSLLPFPFS